MEIRLNGKPFRVESEMTVGSLLSKRGVAPEWVIVEMNGTVLAREKFAQILLREGDRLEIVQAIAGG